MPTFYAGRRQLPPAAFASARACRRAAAAAETRRLAQRFGVEMTARRDETVFMTPRSGPGRAGRATGRPCPASGAPAGRRGSRGGGGRGVLWVRAPSLAAGYWQRAEASGRAFSGGWFRTGDVCYRDAAGDYVHCGRDDDSFKVAGMWVQPAELEAAALAEPAVLEAGAVGAAGTAGLVKPFLFVVARDASAPAAVLVAALGTRLAAALPPHQRPQAIAVVPELPRTATGKLQRFRLRELAQATPGGESGAGAPGGVPPAGRASMA